MYASDMAFWLLTILTRGKSGEAYNIGSPEPITLSKLAQMITHHVNPSLEIKIKRDQTHTSRFVPDVSSAAKELQLQQRVDLASALQRTIRWNQLMGEKN
jgi:nucleoside-diphosphate-sugar epimerase